MRRLAWLATAPLRIRDDPRPGYAAALAARLRSPHVELTWMGRTGLHAVCRALGIGPGDEVVVSAYTCVVVVRSFALLGASPVYCDIDPATFNTPVQAVLDAITSRTRVVVLQHTYGLPVRVEPILAACRPRGITVVEDACHAFGTTIDGRPAGTLADAGFFSTQWNKPFSTGFGGFLAISNPDLAGKVAAVMRGAARAPAVRTLQLRAQLLAHEAIVTPRTHGLAQAAYRWLYSHGLILGSGTPTEAAGGRYHGVPDEYLQGMSRPQAEAGLFEAARFDAGIERRRAVSAVYAEGLARAGIEPAPSPPGTVYSRYPVRVRNKQDLAREAMLAGIPIGTWFETPLHPIPLARHPDFGMDPDRFPASLAACREVVNLPATLATTDADAERALAFVLRKGRLA